ncbi:MAG TPA: CPBP family intramembrane glutamic endopeptidase [Vicinamibacterales bacterium]|nr:CPBP family intramembrane glutamic endopeptidase [Vicinamibacterales bacterium]
MRFRAAAGRLAFTALAVWAFWVLSSLDVELFGFATGQGLLKLVIWGLPCVLIARVVNLGLTNDPWRGYGLGAVATIPMLAAWLFSPALTRLDVIVGDAILGPLAEEILFRGFLFFGLRRLGISFWSAVTLSALAFGAAHLMNLQESMKWLSMSIVAAEWRTQFLQFAWSTSGAAGAISAAGAGVLFAWLTERTGSLWPAIGLHTAINFWWVMSHRSGALSQQMQTGWMIASALSTVAAVILIERHRKRQVAAASVSVASVACHGVGHEGLNEGLEF